MCTEDPPFYLHRSSSSDGDSACAIPSDTVRHRHLNLIHHILPKQSSASRVDMSESSSEDYRSVIDDLTVQNKKLKQKLRKYKKSHCSYPQGDELFEVRFHGLPAHRKRELEAMLQSFASKLVEDPERTSHLPSSLGTNPSFDYMTTAHKPLASSTSCSRPVDSAYASMSASEPASGSLPQGQSPQRPERFKQSVRAKEQNIHSYLHDIPKGILPRRLHVMTEKAKKRSVVRRLEQLFTGTGASTGLHSQSLQQQEVSQSAAKADRSATEAQGRRISAEGVREARILPANTEMVADSLNLPKSSSFGRYHEDTEGSRSGGTNTSSDQSPDQRPTRPLDLDPYRAQVPAENIQYIRHLGLASPLRCTTLPSEDTHDWVYLNLLTSMAQLHTINVTPDFVRKAVAEVSTKLEVSPDGRKIRWRGGTEGTRISSDSSRSGSPPGNAINMCASNKRRKIKDNQLPGDCGAYAKRKPILRGQTSTANSFRYKTLFVHRARFEEQEYCVSDSDSPRSFGVCGDVAVTRNGFDTTLPPALEKSRKDGPIIYYKGAHFCTDLSGDSNVGPYYDAGASGSSTGILGCAPSADMSSDPGREDSPVDGDMTSESAGSGRRLIDIEEAMAGLEDMSSGNYPTFSTPLQLEASGIGGVQPTDNFSVNVLVRHEITKKSDSQTMSCFPLPKGEVHDVIHRVQHCSIDGLCEGLRPSSQEGPRRAVQREVVSTKKIHLPPSTLPPPSHVFHPFSSSDSDDDGDSSEPDSADENSLSVHQGDENLTPPILLHRSSTRATQQSSYLWSSSGTDDSSIDLLAHAREFDPDTIAAREREFEDNIGQQLPTEIPTGSSAATVGSGVGVSSTPNSPTPVVYEGGRQNLKRRKSKRP